MIILGFIFIFFGIIYLNFWIAKKSLTIIPILLILVGLTMIITFVETYWIPILFAYNVFAIWWWQKVK